MIVENCRKKQSSTDMIYANGVYMDQIEFGFKKLKLKQYRILHIRSSKITTYFSIKLTHFGPDE
jgi:hypothetical protein